VVAVGCTSSADETATPVEATEPLDWLSSEVAETTAEEVGWTSSEDWTAAPVEATEGLVATVG